MGLQHSGFFQWNRKMSIRYEWAQKNTAGASKPLWTEQYLIRERVAVSHSNRTDWLLLVHRSCDLVVIGLI